MREDRRAAPAKSHVSSISPAPLADRATFSEWLAARLNTRQWVVASRLTPRLRAKGYELALTQRRFALLQAEFDARLRAEADAVSRHQVSGKPHSVIDLYRDGSLFAVREGVPADFPRVDAERIIFTSATV